MRSTVILGLLVLCVCASIARAGEFIGSLYIQSNASESNEVFHYGRAADGRLTLIGKHPTGGKGSGTFKPLTGQDPGPNAFEAAGSVILSPDCKWLFATNGGDNSVSSFRVSSRTA